MRSILFIIFFPSCCFAQTNHSIHDLKAGKFVDDTSYIYSLPFEKGKKVLLIQGYNSNFSHKGEKALDFKVKTGTRVCAARDGIVESTREDSDKGGLKPGNLSDGNYVIILHADGSKAFYWHFKKDGVMVNEGDTISKGQLIGYSGNTGYSAFPHLHFEVQGYDHKGTFTQLPTRFQTAKGIKYLRPVKFYKTE